MQGVILYKIVGECIFARFTSISFTRVRIVPTSPNIIRYDVLFFSLKKEKVFFRKMSGPCCVNPGAKQSHEAQGSEEQIAGVNTYKSGEGKSAIVILTDIFGYSFINVRKIADSFAQATQTTVLIPDLFNGDPMNPDDPNLWDKLPAWIKKHPVTDACAIAEKILSTIKGHYQSIQVNNKDLFISFFHFYFRSWAFVMVVK